MTAQPGPGPGRRKTPTAVRVERSTPRSAAAIAVAARTLPPHLSGWRLPPDWRWGADSLMGEHRHFQEVVDALGRSLSLVTAPDPRHAAWLEAEARHLAHRNHPSVPTTYHFWTNARESGRGPGYLRRWIAGETIAARLGRRGSEGVTEMLRILRAVGSTLAYLHDGGTVHGAVGPRAVWMTPTGRIWMLGWQWAMPRAEIPPGLLPDLSAMPLPPEWGPGEWAPTPASDQWQLAALGFAMLTGELPPTTGVPPMRLVCPDCPQSVAAVLERALVPEPEGRHHSVSALLRALDRMVDTRTAIVTEESRAGGSEEARLRWATGEDYEVLASLGAGTFGSVWRVRDLSLGREVALKMLHPHVAKDQEAVSRFHREARLAAQLAHPAIVPIYDWDTRGDVEWYTMELAESGSLADLIARSGPRALTEVAAQLDHVLDALAAAHAIGVVHRDLKPENILIDRYRRWRITDFGIANVWGEDEAGTGGTPAFAAPEQLLGEPQGPPADCFALASIVVYAVTGELPFGAADARAILARQMGGLEWLEEYPPEIERWLRRALAPEPAERYADAGEMRTAWQEALDDFRRREARAAWWRRWGSTRR